MTPTIVSQEGLHLQFDTLTGQVSLENLPEHLDLGQCPLGVLVADDEGEVLVTYWNGKDN